MNLDLRIRETPAPPPRPMHDATFSEEWFGPGRARLSALPLGTSPLFLDWSQVECSAGKFAAGIVDCMVEKRVSEYQCGEGFTLVVLSYPQPASLVAGLAETGTCISRLGEAGAMHFARWLDSEPRTYQIDQQYLDSMRAAQAELEEEMEEDRRLDRAARGLVRD